VKRHPSLLILLTAFLAAMMTACVNDSDESEGKDTLITVGDKIPEFNIQGTNGQVITPESLAGQTYILNFFDTTCPDCRKELEVLQLIHEKYGASVPILNVPRSQTSEEVQEYWNVNGLTMPYYTATSRLYYMFATRGIPRTYIVDNEGRVNAAFSDSPIADYETLDSKLEALNKDMVNLKLKINVPNTRGERDDTYFHNEYAISRLDFWFFDTETKDFFTKTTVRRLGEENIIFDTEYDITYVVNNVRVRAGVYDIFVIANYEDCPDSVKTEKELLDMVDTVTYKNGLEASLPEEGPVMTNRATTLLGVNLLPYINKDYTLSVDLERVMAKLQIGAQNPFVLTHNSRIYANINITNYKLVNLNTQYYLFMHMDSMDELGEQPDFKIPENYNGYYEEGNQYVVDPFFYQKKNNTVDGMAFADIYSSWYGNFNTENLASMPSVNNYGYVYILENTAFKSSQLNGYMPGIVFKAAVSPVFVYLYDKDNRILRQESRPEYWPQNIYMYKYNFYGSIQAVNAESGLQLDELKTYTDEELKIYGIKQCKFNMGVYETYYTYWIHHRGKSSLEAMGPMEYGIVRNNYYQIKVTGVSGIGNSVITPEIMRNNYPNSYADITVN
jgi:peroxiredoxin